MNKLFTLLLVLMLSSCTSQNDFESGRRVLENSGFTQVTNTGHRWFGCADGDNFRTGFKATDKQGNKVTGCFCSGWTKGVTVRFD